MYALENPEPRLSRMGWQQVQPAARLLYNLFAPAGGPFMWREVTDPEEGADEFPFGDDVAELFATVGYVLDLVAYAPVITDIVLHVALVDPAGEYLRARALDQGRDAWDPPVPVSEIFAPHDSGRLPDTAPWIELHREAKRPWIAAAAGILSAAGAHIVAEQGEQA